MLGLILLIAFVIALKAIAFILRDALWIDCQPNSLPVRLNYGMLGRKPGHAFLFFDLAPKIQYNICMMKKGKHAEFPNAVTVLKDEDKVFSAITVNGVTFVNKDHNCINEDNARNLGNQDYLLLQDFIKFELGRKGYRISQ